ncbi:MAG: LysR family transcriptional regulator [Eggerthellaceae bacterium]|nr:LysR family transcriptional regulator [Eggerthellaceae bacterium]
MRYEYLKEFREIAHCLSFSDAARELNITQPNLSKHMAQLENEIGFKLFTDTRKTHLTRAGRRYLNAVCNMIFEHETALEQCRRMGNVEKLSVLEPLFQDEIASILFRAVASLGDQLDQRDVIFVSKKSKRALDLLAEGYVDVATTRAACNADQLVAEASAMGLTLEPITSVPLLVWVHRDHPLASKEATTVEEVCEWNILFPANRSFDDFRFAIVSILDAENKPKDRAHLPNIWPASNLEEYYLNVNKTDVCFITPMMQHSLILATYDDMVTVPLADETARITYFAGRRADCDDEDVLALIAKMREQAASPAQVPGARD